MFGLGFGEILVLLLVSMVVLGPRELPRYLRKAGQFAGKMRRLAYDMREKSGIDEVLRSEGLDRDIAEIRRLTRGELASLTGIVRGATSFASPQNEVGNYGAARTLQAAPAWEPAAPVPFSPAMVPVDRAHEYPTEGADAYGALPDNAVVYEGSLAPSPLALDSLYAHGEDAPAHGEGTPVEAPPQPREEATS